MLNLRKRNISLSANASFRKVNVSDEKAVYAFVREKRGKKVFIVLNFSNQAQIINIKDESLLGTAYNVFINTKETLAAKVEI